MPYMIRTATFATLALVAAVLAAGTHPAVAQSTTVDAPPSASPTPIPLPENPPENPLITTRVTNAFLAWQRGRIDRHQYTPTAGGTYIDALVAQVQPNLQAVGAPQTTTYQTAALLYGNLVYRYQIVGDKGAVSVLYALDQNGKIDGITFTPLIFRSDLPLTQ